MTSKLRGELQPDQVRAYCLAGHATVTVVSGKTGDRYTFKIQVPKVGDPSRPPVHFVKVLTGSDNVSSYTFLGTIFDRSRYAHGRKSPIGPDAPSARVFAWFWDKLATVGQVEGVRVFHEGACARCGRALTVPESVATGYGPECSAKLGLDRAVPVPAPAVEEENVLDQGDTLEDSRRWASAGVVPVERVPFTGAPRRARKPRRVPPRDEKILAALRAENQDWLDELQAGIDADRVLEGRAA